MQYQTQLKIVTGAKGHTVYCSVEYLSPRHAGRRSHIEKMEFKRNQTLFALVQVGQAMADNPIVAVELLNAKEGDVVTAQWIDTDGNRGTARKRVTR